MTESPDPPRRLILAAVALAQLMIVLDVTVVHIPLPSAQTDLSFGDDSRQWVITAYALALGSAASGRSSSACWASRARPRSARWSRFMGRAPVPHPRLPLGFPRSGPGWRSSRWAGGSLGVALLSTVFAGAVSDFAPPSLGQATAHGSTGSASSVVARARESTGPYVGGYGCP